jgi:phospholipid-binding lipoprotein MlaA
MRAKTMLCICMLLFLSTTVSPSVYAADNNETQDTADTAQQLMTSNADDDPFADDPFGDENEDSAISETQFPDPIQGFNRPMFTFNDKMYYYALKPTAQGLAFITPKQSRVCLKNFFYNIFMPKRALNCLFQGRGADLGVELWRFIINSTAGIGGLFDPASSIFYLPTYLEDTGLTFGNYGAGPGFYLTIPVLGPSSGRDGTGKIFDIAMDPLTYVGLPGIRLLDTIIKVSLEPDAYDEIKAASLDPYVAIRNGYLQNREAAIQK